MEKVNPKLRYGLAKKALWHFYHNQYLTEEELIVWNKFCDKNPDKLWKLKMRLICEENNDIIVAAVVADATEEERIFLTDKYLRGESFVTIGNKLNIHPNALQRWRDKFLADIVKLLNFELPTSDLFSINKIEALVYVLERLIVFHEEYKKSDRKLLDVLKIKLNLYNDMLFALREFLALDIDDIGFKIIKSKIQNNGMSIKCLEKCTGYSHTTISNYVRIYQRKFCKNLKTIEKNLHNK